MHAGEQGSNSACSDAQYAAVYVGHEELSSKARRTRIREGGGKGATEITTERVPQSRCDSRGCDDGPGGEASPRTRVPAIYRTLFHYRGAADPDGKHPACPGQDHSRPRCSG